MVDKTNQHRWWDPVTGDAELIIYQIYILMETPVVRIIPPNILHYPTKLNMDVHFYHDLKWYEHM